MSDIFVLNTPRYSSFRSAIGEMRYVVRNGERILQQAWVVTNVHNGTGEPVDRYTEWEDVPTEDEHEE